MEDFRIKTSWRTHRKRRKLKRLLGADGVLAIEDLWSYCAAERESGDLSGLSNEDIADEVAWDGNDPDELVNGFVNCGLLDGEPGAYRIHDWEDHNPYVATGDTRSESAAYKAHVRWHVKRGENKEGCQWCGGAPVPQQCSGNAGSNADDASALQDAYKVYAPPLPPTIPTYPPTEPTNQIDIREAAPPGDSGWPDPAVEAGGGESPLPQEKARGSPRWAGEVQEVYQHYRGYHPRCPEKLSSKSKLYRAIVGRLSEGWPVADLCKAIDGFHVNPWHIGENPSGTKYLKLEMMMRSFDQVTSGLGYLEQKGAPVMSERERRGRRAAASWAARSSDAGQG